MNIQEIKQKYCIDAPEPTKADADAYFKAEQEIAKVNMAMDRLKPNDKRAKGFLEKAKKLYMDFAKNSMKIKAMVDKGMLGRFENDYNRIKRRWDGQYSFIARCCSAAMRGKDPQDVGL